MALPPNTDNYYIGKGNVYFKKEGASDYRHVGNVPELEFTPTVEKLDHFSSMAGTRSKDKTIVLERGGTLRIVMEELTAENLAMLFMSDVENVDATTDVDQHLLIDIMSSDAVSGAVKFVSSNDIGPQIEMEFYKVDFIPGSSFNPISDEWGQMEVNGELATTEDGFGTIKVFDAELATP